jgi:zinc transport system substrate-binding protein
MKNILKYIFLLILISCNRHGTNTGSKTITVSIPPFKYFVEAIGGEDFKVNVMVPAGSNPHIYEPAPGQITNLRNSVGYISNGYLGFELTWLDRFYETNRNMKRLSLGDTIDLIRSGTNSEGGHMEGADPHYWISPLCALAISARIKSFLCELNPVNKEKYEINYQKLILTIREIDKKAKDSFSGFQNRTFMIFHPTLGYLARDYGLKELDVEYEGKEPTPSRMRELIDRSKSDNIKVIFVQKEYDTKNARAIAAETGAVITTIDPLSENWPGSLMEIINALQNSFIKSAK